MNLLVKNSREFLPQDKQLLIEQKERIHHYRKRLSIILACCLVIVISLISFPQFILKTSSYVAPIYGVYKRDPIITQGFVVKTISGKDIASVLNANQISDARIASQQQLAEIIVKPSVNEQQVQNADARVLKLHRFLVSQGSPMAGSAATFVAVADRYGIDWTLLPAIADTESGLGRVVPINGNGVPSYNPFGFGVYGGTFLSFASWDDSIRRVGGSLVNDYGVKGLQPWYMEANYCPPSYASDHHWALSVQTVQYELKH